MVIDTDGSAFITKAEFDSLKNNFQAQIDSYNSAIDSKIDGAIASYLSGIQVASEFPQIIPWATKSVGFTALPSHARLGFAPPAMFYRPFPSRGDGQLFFKSFELKLGKDQEPMPGFQAKYWETQDNKFLLLDPIGAPLQAADESFCAGFKDAADALFGGSWVDYYKALPTDGTMQEKKNFWWDALSASAFYTEDNGSYGVVRGLGRIGTAPQCNLLGVKYALTNWTAAKFVFPEGYDCAWHMIDGNYEPGENSLLALKLKVREPQYVTSIKHEYIVDGANADFKTSIDSATGTVSTRVKIGPVKYTTSLLTGTELDPIIDDAWQEDTDGYIAQYTYRLCNPTAVVSEPVRGFAATGITDAGPTSSNTKLTDLPYINCGELLINEDYGGEYFDQDSLWKKQSSTPWLDRNIMEWRYGVGPIVSELTNIVNNALKPFKFGGRIYVYNGVFGSLSGSVYSRSDGGNPMFELAGTLPVYKITPKESEKKKITDFYAPLYGNDTMSPYGKSYVDGACICKVATDGDNLRVKLKSTEETTLYFNKNPFTTCDAAGNMGYIANGTPYSAGNGVHVNANETITIDIKNVLAEDRYYVKPDTATTIQFESATVTQDS